jgi:hypothetical protein
MSTQATPQPDEHGVLQLRVPATFWDDHCERCPCDGDPEVELAREVGRSGARVLIAGTASQIEWLRSDAEFYCDPAGPDEAPKGLVRSAAATIAALKRQGFQKPC